MTAPTDDEIAHWIHDSVKHLNEAMYEACKYGVEVEIDINTESQMCGPSLSSIHAKVRKVLK